MYFKLDASTQKVVAKATCGKTPPGEIAIRTAMCNFNCIPCFAAGYSHLDKLKARKSRDIVEITDAVLLIKEFEDYIEKNKLYASKCNPPHFNWLRIVGGEPLINDNNLIILLDFLEGVSNRADYFGGNIIIQTNGYFLGSKETKDILKIFSNYDKFPGKIVFEVSIKGSNKREFSIVTKRPEHDYYIIFNAINNLIAINNKFSNIDYVAIAGFGPNTRFLRGDTTGSKITFYSSRQNMPFFHPDGWDDNFKQLHMHISDKYPQFGEKMPMAGLEDRPNWRWGLQSIKRAKIENPDHIYDSFDHEKDEGLENAMEGIKNKFFVTDPAKYYPLLFT
jgi:uncharacterized Fe-S cluster-containing radical SAM superfamily protein